MVLIPLTLLQIYSIRIIHISYLVLIQSEVKGEHQKREFTFLILQHYKHLTVKCAVWCKKFCFLSGREK